MYNKFIPKIKMIDSCFNCINNQMGCFGCRTIVKNKPILRLNKNLLIIILERKHKTNYISLINSNSIITKKIIETINKND
jgi:hypothetical protein